MIANVAGKTLEDYEKICARLDGLVDMIELNISCPNVKSGGMAFGIKPQSVEEVTRVAKKGAGATPLIVKLSNFLSFKILPSIKTFVLKEGCSFANHL